ncbi:3-oxoacyl-ACP reductase FabG [Paenibacillus hunanensis]|uniref:elongation factor P 5-aminopentanone reductase n=1 Tax=Paenibacillus hunanensis TaxID=539262 RepID=UPI002A6B1617|nr:3-oxoacyl-ACP reductase FabG [Paenibacillus hunanensis]WPP39779.1 3-oxoacyl-ACP reductase FabG [Paenibacillus hunanensis]
MSGISSNGSSKPFAEMNVLVTGASRGIGAAIAKRFAMAGMNVIIHYRNSHEQANEVARTCLDYGVRVLTVAVDLREVEEIRRMQTKLEQHGMEPDILVNNAGLSHYGMLADLSEAEFDDIIAANLKAVFFCSQTFMPYMIRQQYGRIINVSSIWGMTGASCEVLYSASKGGVNAFTKALAKELAPSGVTVNAVAPGAVRTDMLAHLHDDELRMLEDDIPAGRMAEPDEIASMVYFLSLPESGYMTGQVVSPNGGWLT